MATKTRAEMINRVLERLGVLGAGQSATAEDAATVGPVLDSAHAELRKLGLAPFATSAFPEWAQEGYAMVIGEMAAPYFGLDRTGWRARGESELSRQMQAARHAHAVELDFY